MRLGLSVLGTNGHLRVPVKQGKCQGPERSTSMPFSAAWLDATGRIVWVEGLTLRTGPLQALRGADARGRRPSSSTAARSLLGIAISVPLMQCVGLTVDRVKPVPRGGAHHHSAPAHYLQSTVPGPAPILLGAGLRLSGSAIRQRSHCVCHGLN